MKESRNQWIRAPQSAPPGDISLSTLSMHMAKMFNEISKICIEQLAKQVQASPEGREAEKDKSKEVFSIQSKKQREFSQELGKKAKYTKAKLPKPQFMQYKPKAPSSSYLIFLHQTKASIIQKYNVTNSSEITKLASKEWKKLSPVEKEKYNQLCHMEKERYKQEMQKYRLKYAQDITEYKRVKQVIYRLKWKENKIGRTNNEGQEVSKKEEDSDSQLSSEHNIVIIKGKAREKENKVNDG